MKAQVRAVYTIDMDQIERHEPADLRHFRIWVRAMVGPEGTDGEESFDISVCTPSWLDDECRRNGFVVGRHQLVVERFDAAYIKKVIIDLVEACEGETWQGVAERLSRIGFWEFEDYKRLGSHS